jgi:hypothetical protein
MKRHTLLVASLTVLALFLLVPCAHADAITMTLTQDGSVLPGGIVDFNASFTNNTASPIFINGDSFSVGFPLSLDDTNFVNYFVLGLTAPVSLAAGGSLTGIDVFTITVDPTAMAGTYGGTFGITGGADQFTFDPITSTDLSVVVGSGVVTPEPGTMLLLGSGLAALGFFRRRAAATP